MFVGARDIGGIVCGTCCRRPGSLPPGLQGVLGSIVGLLRVGTNYTNGWCCKLDWAVRLAGVRRRDAPCEASEAEREAAEAWKRCFEFRGFLAGLKLRVRVTLSSLPSQGIISVPVGMRINERTVHPEDGRSLFS